MEMDWLEHILKPVTLQLQPSLTLSAGPLFWESSSRTPELPVFKTFWKLPPGTWTRL